MNKFFSTIAAVLLLLVGAAASADTLPVGVWNVSVSSKRPFTLLLNVQPNAITVHDGRVGTGTVVSSTPKQITPSAVELYIQFGGGRCGGGSFGTISLKKSNNGKWSGRWSGRCGTRKFSANARATVP